MKRIVAITIFSAMAIGVMAQPSQVPGIPGGGVIPGAPNPIKLIQKPKAMVAYRLEFQVADQVFFVNSIGGKFILNVAHNTPKGERAFTVQGEFLPGVGVEAGMLDFEATLLESNLDEGVDGDYTCKGGSTIKKGQSQQLATLGHHVLSLTVKDVAVKN